jgi:DMSO reductase anchor subunit
MHKPAGLKLVALLGACVVPASVSAQQVPSNISSNPTAGAGNLPGALLSKTAYELWMVCLIVAFGLIVICLYIYAVRHIRDKRPEDVSRAMIVITVITGSLLLITGGYSNEQIAPAFGLFGTIIGYMLGRMSQSNGSKETPPAEKDEPKP